MQVYLLELPAKPARRSAENEVNLWLLILSQLTNVTITSYHTNICSYKHLTCVNLLFMTYNYTIPKGLVVCACANDVNENDGSPEQITGRRRRRL